MRHLLVLFSLLLLLAYSSALPSIVSAASPWTAISLSPDKHFAHVSFGNIRSVSRVAYTLTYRTGSRTTGVEGGFKTKRATTRTSRRQILGTCSTRYCTYHKNPQNFTLTATFHLRSGGTTTLTRSL